MVMAVTPSVPFVPASIAGPTDSARRENQIREVITQVSQSESFARERGMGASPDRAPPPGIPNFSKQVADARQEGEQLRRRAKKDDEQGNTLSESEEKKVEELKQRDQEVRRHEETHASVGGQYAGSPQYDFEQGPDGRNYAVGGQVNIDVTPIPDDPAATVLKMQIVRRAALAPEEPSSADRQVAADAQRKEVEARQQMSEAQREANAESGQENALNADVSDQELERWASRGSAIESAYQTSFRPQENSVLAQA